jgi:hypothetical protein
MNQSKRKIIALFQPQAWQNNNAIDVDPEGETTFDVTDEILAMGKETALKLKDNRDESDALISAKNAPHWIREWSGPFYIVVENSIAAYFAE